MNNPGLRSSELKSTPLRAFRIVGGFALVIVGAVFAIPGVPGPGIPIILLGLWVLSDHFTWARRAHEWVKLRIARLRQNLTDRRS
jgi:hypothetical protein